jgi:TnpA family transposase
MSRIKILEPIEIKRFNTPPVFNQRQRIHFFEFSEELWQQVPDFRKDVSKVGFLIQWGYFKHSGFFYAVSDFHKADIEFVAKQMSVSPKLISMPTYSLRSALEHQQIILDLQSYQGFSKAENTFIKHVEYLVEIPLMPRKVLYQSIQWLSKNKIEKPSYDKFRRIISTAYNQYNQLNNKKLAVLMTPNIKEYLDEIFEINTQTNQMLFNAFKKPSQSLRPMKIKDSLAYFTQLKTYYQTVEHIVKALNFDDAAINYYAYRTLKMRNQHTKTGRERYLYLLCFITHQFRMWQDTFVEVVLKSVTNATNNTKRTQQALTFKNQGQRKAATKILINDRNNYKKQIESAIRILEDPSQYSEKKITNALVILKSQAVLTQQQQELIDNLDRSVNKNEEEEFLQYFSTQYRKTNQRIGGILGALTFDKINSETALMTALDEFIKVNGRIKDPSKDLSWLSDTEVGSLTNEQGNFDKNLYRMLLFRAVSDAFKNGTLVLKESYQYRPFEHYLLDKTYFQTHRERLLEECGFSHLASYENVIKVLKEDLDQQYHKTNQRYLQGENLDLTITDEGDKKIETPLRDRPDELKELEQFFTKAKYINIIDLLSEVEKNTFYLSEIEHLGGKHAKTRPDQETLFAGIVGTGCNIKMDKMANISKGINPSTLQLVNQLYLNPDSLKAANDCLINFKNQLALPEQHRNNAQELHTVSDGQNFFVQSESLNANYSYKFPGYDKMVTVNTGMDERFGIFSIQVISASEKEAPYVIDIVLKNSPVKSTIHSTDTGGYTEAVFGVLNLLGICYAPRLKNLLSQQLYSFAKRREYKGLNYPILPEQNINEKLIEDNWEDLLRLMVTLKSGKTTAHRIFKRLNAYAKQNPLLAAMKEYGKIIKSGFILRYYDEREFRQAIELQLSHIELVNRFSKAVFFGNNQEYLVSLKEEQERVTLARQLIQNAIIVWNYLFLSDQISQMSKQSDVEELLVALRNGTIVHWEHVNLHGIYDFTKLGMKKNPKFDMTKISQLKFASAA